jgi:hypothetical protein
MSGSPIVQNRRSATSTESFLSSYEVSKLDMFITRRNLLAASDNCSRVCEGFATVSSVWDLQLRRLPAGISQFAATARFCRRMCKAPRLPAAPVYGGNNWCYAYGKSSTDDIRQDSERIASLASSANNKPFMVMQLKNTGRQIADLERCSLPAQRILLKWALSIAASCPAPASYLVAKLGGWSRLELQ